MLIYNFQKEFLGIDEKDLNTLGYKDLSELQKEVADFADLFVKTPGYISNFKHVHWLDYITCADSNDESKVIINANTKSFKAIITVTTTYLMDNPSQKAYIVNLNNLRALTSQEHENIADDIIQRPPLENIPEQIQIRSQIEETSVPIVDEYDTSLHVEEDLSHTKPIQTSEPIPEPIPTPEHRPVSEPMIEAINTTIKAPKEQKSDYSFDPNIASKELGLPLDLIEEFLQDFIDQANDFRTGLYASLDEGDINNLKILSHKLKGVAANLRIEDAHEILSVINAASDTDVIKTNLDDFYKIITTLSGNGPAAEEPTPQIEEVASREELILSIKDEDVPEKIDIPELIDDEFLTPDMQEHTYEDEKLEINLDDELILDFKDDELEDVKPESETEIEVEPETQTEEELKDNIENNDKYSKEQIANEIGLDLESFNELFKDFVEEAHSIFTKITDAISIEDLSASKRYALKFKGMSDNMRMHMFTNELETLIHSTDKEKITEAVKKIEHILTTILKKED